MFAFYSDRFVHMIFVPNVRRQPFFHHTTTLDDDDDDDDDKTWRQDGAAVHYVWYW